MVHLWIWGRTELFGMEVIDLSLSVTAVFVFYLMYSEGMREKPSSMQMENDYSKTIESSPGRVWKKFDTHIFKSVKF